MKGGTANDFLEDIRCEEAAVMYHGKKYFFQGLVCGRRENLWSCEIDLWTENETTVVYEEYFESEEECWEHFLSDPIIDGKSFWELEPEMEWVPW